MKRSAAATIPAACLLVLILDSKTAMLGAREGVSLCMMTVVPSLFPFFVLTALLTSALSGTEPGFLRPLGKLCGIPGSALAVLPMGLLGGYPTGAQSISQLYRSGSLTKEQAQRLLCFCSNAGPAVIFGICGALFPDAWMVWLLWLVHILSAVAVGAILREDAHCDVPQKPMPILTLPQALDRALKTTGRVCGWIVLFRIVISFLSKWMLRSADPLWDTLITGFLELTNGCCQLSLVGNVGARFVLASAFLSFGGICVWMQTASVVEELGTASYLRGKLLQTVISVFLSLMFQWLLFPTAERMTFSVFQWILLIIFVLCASIFLIFRKKRVAIRHSLVYT